MRHPLNNHFNTRQGYKHGDPTFYSDFHFGIDYIVNEQPVYAPTDGQMIRSFIGNQGGNTGWFKFEHNGQTYVMRLLHLKQLPKLGMYKEGDVIAISGNTGSTTTGAHLHLDISKDDVSLYNKDNFIDPEYFFMSQVTQTMLVVFNELNSEQQQMVKNAIKTISEKVNKATNNLIDIEYKFVDRSEVILRTVRGNGLTGIWNTIKQIAYVDQDQIFDLARQHGRYDVVCLAYDTEVVAPDTVKSPVHNNVLVDETTAIQVPINDGASQDYVNYIIFHELLHAWYFLVNKRGGSVRDRVHECAYEDNDPTQRKSYTDIVVDLMPYAELLTTNFKKMRYVIIGTEQYLLDENLKIALNIGDPEQLEILKSRGLSNDPEHLPNIDSYLQYPLVTKDKLRDLLGL